MGWDDAGQSRDAAYTRTRCWLEVREQLRAAKCRVGGRRLVTRVAVGMKGHGDAIACSASRHESIELIFLEVMPFCTMVRGLEISQKESEVGCSAGHGPFSL